MPREEVDGTLKGMWQRYAEAAPLIPRPQGLGPTQLLHLAAITIAFHQTLLDAGYADEAATQLVADIAWVIYRKMGAFVWLLTRLAAKDRFERMRLSTRIFRRFPFSSPDYQWREVSAPPNIVAFDCTRCPVAEYFASKNRAALCVKTFCNLDFPLAKDWGAELERSGSIAGGAPRCDFRWRSVPLG
jgi:L-2-amino-thiazoline-4-carboxylic acid hydrolase-like protein